MKNNLASAIKNYLVDFFSLKGYIENQDIAEQEIRQGINFRGTNIYILILATFVASLGLNTNSTAVIIGAMLISPLMGPILGIGMSVGIQDFELLKRSLRNLTMAAGFSIIASTIYFLISPVGEVHSELLARTSPTIYDVLIAFFGGGAGIIGTSSRAKGNVIPGVAIATALMPPLCTVGYGIATWQPNYFIGALYLFIINSIFIALATFLGVKLLKFTPFKSDNPERARKVRKWVYAISVITLLPSIYLTYNMLRQSRININAEKFVTEEFRFPETQVIREQVTMRNGKPTLEVTLIGKALPADSLHLAMASRMAEFGLKNMDLNIIQGSSALANSEADRNNIQNNSISEIYDVAQKAVLSRQQTIDSLRQSLAGMLRRDTIGVEMAPELRVVFPEIRDISISRNVVCDINNNSLDTIEVALLRYNSSMSSARRQKLREYLEARLNTRKVTLVTLP